MTRWCRSARRSTRCRWRTGTSEGDVNDPPALLEVDKAELIAPAGRRGTAGDRDLGPIAVERDDGLFNERRGVARALRPDGSRGRRCNRARRAGWEPGRCDHGLRGGVMGDHFRRQDVGGQRFPILVRQAEIECPERGSKLGLRRIRLGWQLLGRSRRGAGDQRGYERRGGRVPPPRAPRLIPRHGR